MTSSPLPGVLLLHGGQASDPAPVIAKLTSALSCWARVEATQDVSRLSTLKNGGYRAVIVYTSGRQGELSPELARTLAQFVEQGGGVVALHGATNSFTDQPAYAALLGCQFVKHGPVMPIAVSIKDAAHPVVARTQGFEVVDEAFELKLLGTDARVFAETYWHGKMLPLGYERSVGKGSVIVLTPGHDAQSFTPSYLRLVTRAVRRACGETFTGTVKAGFLGWGGAFNIGLAHANGIRAQPGMSVTAVCDLDAKRAAQAKTDLGEKTQTFTDPARFLAEADCDLIVQILPHNLHAKTSIEALKAGKHVVSEKPMCITLREADDMIAAARQGKRMLSVFHNRRWDGDFLTMLRLVRRGDIGQVFRIDAAMGGMGRPGTWWRSSKEISGGVLYDWGAHYADWILNLIPQRIESVSGIVLPSLRWHHATNEDYGQSIIRFVDGSVATIEMSSLVASPKFNGFRILGTQGSISNNGPGDALVVRRHESDGSVSEAKQPVPDGKWNDYYADVGNHLIAGEELVVKPEEARRAIAVLALAEQSAQQGGKPLPLPGEETFQPRYLFPW